MEATLQHSKHTIDDLIRLFDDTFFDAHNTRLVRGSDEPVYLPASAHQDSNQIVFAHGFFASALHEIAHWCLAGAERRQQVDYGYWYCPDGRDAEQQAAFEKVEVKPQAIEWAFSVAAGRTFKVSTDNLEGVQPDRKRFAQHVYQQVEDYLEHGFPLRAAQFIQCLRQHYHMPSLTISQFDKELAGA